MRIYQQVLVRCLDIRLLRSARNDMLLRFAPHASPERPTPAMRARRGGQGRNDPRMFRTVIARSVSDKAIFCLISPRIAANF